MNNDNEVQFVYTEPCYICRGSHAEYVNRQCCRNCESLRDVLMKRGILIRPPDTKHPTVTHDIVDKIFTMRDAGATHREIAAAIGLSENTVNSYMWKANKAAGVTRTYKKRGDVDAKQAGF